MPPPELDQELLAILACPETKEPVRLADAATVAAVNAAIEARRCTSRDGQPVPRAIDAGLVRADGRVLYPVRGGIPIMLIDESIELQQLGR